MKKIIGALAALLLAVSGVIPATADDAYLPEDAPRTGEDTIMFSVSEEGTTGLSTSVLVADRSGKGKGTGSWNCDSITDSECKIPTKADMLWGATVFGVCETASDINCVESLSIALPGEEMQEAVFVEQPSGIVIPADPKTKYPGGETPTLWSAPGAPSESGTTDYMVNLRVGGALDPKNLAKTWTFGDLSLNVIPYRVIEDPSYVAASQGGEENEDGSRHYGIGGNTSECAWTDNGRCGRQQNFVEGTKVKVAIRVSKTIGGWFRGRMKDPIINITSLNAEYNRIAVEAQAVTIQKLNYVTPREEMTSQEKKYFSESRGPTKYGAGSWYPAAYNGIFDYIAYFKKKVNDTAAGTNVVWSMGTTQSGRGSKCLSDDDRVLGIVTTNAMGFDGASPAYNKGLLSYNIGGLHFMPDGETPFEGSYDLVMRSDVARCLYGFNKAPVSATITVSGEGDKSIATSIVSEKNGWLKLAAYGFTFSNKTLKVKLTQKKTTITCVTKKKPIKTKKVTGYSPKCPTGYKKK